MLRDKYYQTYISNMTALLSLLSSPVQPVIYVMKFWSSDWLLTWLILGASSPRGIRIVTEALWPPLQTALIFRVNVSLLLKEVLVFPRPVKGGTLTVSGSCVWTSRGISWEISGLWLFTSQSRWHLCGVDKARMLAAHGFWITSQELHGCKTPISEASLDPGGQWVTWVQSWHLGWLFPEAFGFQTANPSEPANMAWRMLEILTPSGRKQRQGLCCVRPTPALLLLELRAAWPIGGRQCRRPDTKGKSYPQRSRVVCPEGAGGRGRHLGGGVLQLPENEEMTGLGSIPSWELRSWKPLWTAKIIF